MNAERRAEAEAGPTQGPGAAGASLESLDEEALVRACVDGRPGAFDVVVARHRRSVYNLCCRFAGNAEDAADLAQEVFLRAFRALGRFQGQSSLGTWLYRIAVNTCLNSRAAASPRLEALDDHPGLAVQGGDALLGVLSAERAARVRAAISKLPDKQRATLILRVYQELSHQEIAEVLGTTEGTAKANFFHALKNLRKLLGGEAS